MPIHSENEFIETMVGIDPKGSAFPCFLTKTRRKANGYECPLFTYEQACVVASSQSKTWRYDKLRDTFYLDIGGITEEYAGVSTTQGVLYDIGAGNWSWIEIKSIHDRFTVKKTELPLQYHVIDSQCANRLLLSCSTEESAGKVGELLNACHRARRLSISMPSDVVKSFDAIIQ